MDIPCTESKQLWGHLNKPRFLLLQVDRLFRMFCSLEELSSEAELKLTQAFVTVQKPDFGNTAWRPRTSAERTDAWNFTRMWVWFKNKKWKHSEGQIKFLFDHQQLRPLEVSEQLWAETRLPPHFYREQHWTWSLESQCILGVYKPDKDLKGGLLKAMNPLQEQIKGNLSMC